jgi:hypothetical protein
VFSTVGAPVGSQVTNALDSSVGPVANGFAGGTAQLTGLLAQLSGGAAGVIAPTSLAASSAPPVGGPPSLGNVVESLGGTDRPSVTSVPDPSAQTINVTSAPALNPQTTPPSGNPPATVAEASVPQGNEQAPARKRPLLNVITGTPNPVGTVLGNGRTPIRTAATNVQNQLRTAVENTQKQISDAVTNTFKVVSDAVGSLGQPASGTSSTTESSGSATP